MPRKLTHERLTGLDVKERGGEGQRRERLRGCRFAGHRTSSERERAPFSTIASGAAWAAVGTNHILPNSIVFPPQSFSGHGHFRRTTFQRPEVRRVSPTNSAGARTHLSPDVPHQDPPVRSTGDRAPAAHAHACARDGTRVPAQRGRQVQHPRHLFNVHCGRTTDRSSHHWGPAGSNRLTAVCFRTPKKKKGNTAAAVVLKSKKKAIGERRDNNGNVEEKRV